MFNLRDTNVFILPVDKFHIIKKIGDNWEYISQENKNIRKGYFFDENEVDYETYNFDGFLYNGKHTDGAVCVNLSSGNKRRSCTYDASGRIVRDDFLTLVQVKDNLSRIAKKDAFSFYEQKKKKLVRCKRLQPVRLKLDDKHKLMQTSAGVWRYYSKVSNRIYVLYFSEFQVNKDEIIIALYDRPVRVYDNKKPLVFPGEEVVKYLISREKEEYFEESITFPVNDSFVLHRRGWGYYFYYLTEDFKLHGFMLNEDDKLEHDPPHIMDLSNINNTYNNVTLNGDVYEEYLVMDDEEHVPTGIFYAASYLGKLPKDSPFYGQYLRIEELKNRQKFQRSVIKV